MRNGVQLIAYADRLGGSLSGLRDLLDGPLQGAFTGVHVLPFFRPHDGADAGFDPEDHTEVDPRLGGWADVRALAEGHELVADLIVNHVSTRSPQFRDWQARGEGSEQAGLFLTLDAVFPDGASEAELLQIYRPRPGLPFTPVTLRGGARRLLWTTFTPAQADIDVRSGEGRHYLHEVLSALAAGGVSVVRLDAVGYAVKTAGTSCFMTPQTFAFVDELTAEARELGLEVLVEVHGHHSLQLEVAARVDRVYDFALPPLVLHGLYTGDEAPLARWLQIRPANAVTVLDTHDGIGVIDVGADQADPSLAGLLQADQIDALVEGIHERSGGASRQATGAAASNVDLYQVNCTFWDALGGDEARYGLARLLQLIVPGVPQIYYVGLLAGANDMELLARTGIGRDVNRHCYGPDELERALAQPVVRALLALARLRCEHPAFGGEFDVPETAAGSLTLRWRREQDEARLEADLAAGAFRLTYSDGGATAEVTDLAQVAGPAPGRSR